MGWTSNTADNGLIVNGNNVEATGLFVEHYQKTEVAWNGQNGKIIFFQNEMPYDPPNQAAWMNGSQNGYPAIAVASNVTSFGGVGPGQLLLLQRQSGRQFGYNAFSSPSTSGVAWHDLLTVSLGGVGTITHVINTHRSGHGVQHHAEQRGELPMSERNGRRPWPWRSARSRMYGPQQGEPARCMPTDPATGLRPRMRRTRPPAVSG